MSSLQSSYIQTEDDFQQFRSDLKTIFHASRRLPQQVFNNEYEGWRFLDFAVVLSQSFWCGLHSLAQGFGDDSINFSMISPDPRSYHKTFGHFGMYSIKIDQGSDIYSEKMFADPGGSPADALQHIVSVACWWGSSRRWGFWGERDLGVVIGAAREASSPGWFPEMPKAVDTAGVALSQLVALEFRDRIIPPQFSSEFLSHFGTSRNA